jgi:NhaA family Na+:H+ antiporter
VALWFAFLKAGVHATIAGVLAALTIPSTARIDTGAFRGGSRRLLDTFEVLDVEPGAHQLSSQEHEVVLGLAGLIEDVAAPLQRLERALHPWVAFLVMPVFALGNAGVVLDAGLVTSAAHPVTLGILLGLVLGKLIGILGFTGLAAAVGIAELPPGVTWRHLTGAGLVAGIGFTMSLFIASLAFGDSPLLDNAKVGILAASLVAGVAGALVLAGAPPGPADARG